MNNVLKKDVHTMRKKTEQKVMYDETQLKIIDATMTLILEKGYSRATTKNIAKLAGVNESTIFRRFDGKKEIVIAAMELSKWNPGLSESDFSYEGNLEKDLISFSRTYMNKVTPQMVKVSIGLRSAELEEAALPGIMKTPAVFKKVLVDYFTEMIENGKIPVYPFYDGFYFNKFTRKIAPPSMARTTPVARFKVMALALLANFAAIRAHKSVKPMQRIKGSNWGIPPIIKWLPAPVKAVNAIIKTLVPTAVFNSYPRILVSSKSIIIPPPAPINPHIKPTTVPQRTD